MLAVRRHVENYKEPGPEHGLADLYDLCFVREDVNYKTDDADEER